MFFSYTGSSFDGIIAAHESGASSVAHNLTAVSDGVVMVDTVSGRWYAVTVTVENNRMLTSSYTQYIQIKPTHDLRIK